MRAGRGLSARLTSSKRIESCDGLIWKAEPPPSGTTSTSPVPAAPAGPARTSDSDSAAHVAVSRAAMHFRGVSQVELDRT